MTFELLFRSGGHDKVSNLWRKETAQSAHALDLADLISNTLFELLIEFENLLGSLAQFIKQPRVLDGDYRLVGETLHQVQIALLEGLYFAARDNHHADCLAPP